LFRFENQVLVSGATISLSHNFSSGELKIGARQGQAFVDATVSVISKKTGKSVAAGRTYSSAATNPKTMIIEPGDYRVDLNPVKPKGLPKKSIEFSIKATETVERTVEW